MRILSASDLLCRGEIHWLLANSSINVELLRKEVTCCQEKPPRFDGI